VYKYSPGLTALPYAVAVPVTKDAAPALRAALDQLKQYLAHPGDKLSEADTRAFFIDPLVAALGYSGFADVARELLLKDTKERLDYLLRIDGLPRVGIEAKAIGQELTDSDAAQVIQYCSILGIEWAVVTNARQWWLYHQFAQAPLQGKLVFKLDLAGWNSDAQFDAVAAQLLLLSKQAFTDAGGPAMWMRAQKLDASLRDALTNPQSPETEYLRNRLQADVTGVTTEDIAAWAKSKLAEPMPALPIQTWHVSQPPSHPDAVNAITPDVVAQGKTAYWLVPAGPRKGLSAVDSMRYWLDSGKWGFFESTPNRSTVKKGDLIAFYAASKGIAAWAVVADSANLLITPEEWPEPVPQDRPVYKVPLSEVHWLPKPLSIDLQLRSGLDAFKGKKADVHWAWFVQATHALTPNDFNRLIGANEK